MLYGEGEAGEQLPLPEYMPGVAGMRALAAGADVYQIPQGSTWVPFSTVPPGRASRQASSPQRARNRRESGFWGSVE